MDLYVLERAFVSTHPDSEPFFSLILKAYATQVGNEWSTIGRRLHDGKLYVVGCVDQSRKIFSTPSWSETQHGRVNQKAFRVLYIVLLSSFLKLPTVVMQFSARAVFVESGSHQNKRRSPKSPVDTLSIPSSPWSTTVRVSISLQLYGTSRDGSPTPDDSQAIIFRPSFITFSRRKPWFGNAIAFIGGLRQSRLDYPAADQLESAIL